MDKLKELLTITNYDVEETNFLIDGFTDGFDICYTGPEDVKQESNNLKFTIGDKTELWNKVMKEVKEGRYAGPFNKPPFDTYIQSPIGLVPKDKGKKTRLIFHLSHPRDSTKGISVNAHIPKSICRVTYKKLDDAVRLCIKEGKGCYLGKSGHVFCFQTFCHEKEMLEILSHESTKSPRQELFCRQMHAIWVFNQLCPFPEILKCHISYCKDHHK